MPSARPTEPSLLPHRTATLPEVRAFPKNAARRPEEIERRMDQWRLGSVEVGMNKSAWTDEENERLRAFVMKGVSIIRVAVVFSRSITGVRNQARKIGAPFPHMRELSKKMGRRAFRA